MHQPMIIDSFAGGGGASTGIELALGRSPDVAINHNPDALALHAANHPETIHLDSNIWDVEPRAVTGGRHVGLMWASPDCKHFSKAKGGAPKDRNIRDLAWVVVRWAEDVKPDVICMENVEEFQTWGPIDNEGQPIKEFAGQTYELWLGCLRAAGYRVQWRELRACDYGAPTIRNRYFLVARRDGRPIRWPKPTHGDPKSAEVRKGKLKPWRTAAECIDWSIPCPSIFDTTDQIMAKHGLRSKRPLADNTLARIARGMKRYVIDADRPFLVRIPSCTTAPSLLSLKGTARRDMPVTAPHPTVLAGGGHSALVAPTLANCANSKTTGRGPNAWNIAEPVRTVTSYGGFSLIAPHLATMRNSAKPWQGADEPTHTITAGGAGLTLCAPVLTYAQHGGSVRDPLAPMHTVTASNKDQNALIIPTIIGCGGRAAQSRPRGMDEPTATGTTKADACVASAFLAQHNTGVVGHDLRAPISTITGAGSHQQPVAAFFAKYYGSGDNSASHDAPLHTVTANDRFGHAEAALAAPPFGPEHEARARDVADFLRAQGAWDGAEFVTLTIDGAAFVVVDIGMRMLTPRELFNAQGFPRDYVIEGVWEGDTFRDFPKDVQVSCCGNSVCPPVAEAIIAANCQHLVADQKESAHG